MAYLWLKQPLIHYEADFIVCLNYLDFSLIKHAAK